VALPVEEGGGGTVAAWCYQQPMALVPVSDACGGRCVIVQAASSEEMAEGSTQQQFQPPFEHGCPTKEGPSKEANMSDL